MLNVEKGQQVITPTGHRGVVIEVSTINQIATGTKGLSKAKVRYSPTQGTVNESWFPLGRLKEFKIEVLVIDDEDAFEDGLEPEKVNPEIKPVEPKEVKLESQDEATF